MEILIINNFGTSAKKTSSVLPRVGDRVDMFYTPAPTVTEVVLWPRKDRLKDLGVSFPVDAIVMVGML